MATTSEVRKIAQAICRLVTHDCVMDEKPKCAVCTTGNCRIMNIAAAAVSQAELLK